MAKDYARATFKTARAKRKQRSRQGLLLAIFLFFALALLAPCGWYLYHSDAAILNKENAIAWLDELKSLLHRQKSEVTVNEDIKTVAASAASEEPTVHFDFYTELPKMQVTLPATQTEAGQGAPQLAAVATRPVKSESVSLNSDQSADGVLGSNARSVTNPRAATQYVIQVGAYKSDSTASEMRVSILLAGFDVTVVKTILDDQIVYRIQEGPYNSLAQAKTAQKKLQAKGYDGVVQKIS